MIGVIILIGIIIVVAGALIFIKYKDYKSTKLEQKQLSQIDRMTVKPAEINVKYVEVMLNDTIKGYFSAVYNLNPQLLPSTLMTQDLYATIYKSMEREYNNGVRKQLIEYIPLKRYKIRQNNSSIYAVSELNVECEYDISYYQKHSTFNVQAKKTIKQVMTFVNHNNGWIMNKAGDEKIINKEEIPL